MPPRARALPRKPSLYSTRQATGRSAFSSTGPGVTLVPRERAASSRARLNRPSAAAFHTAWSASNCTAFTPVSPPWRRSAKHCSVSSRWNSPPSATQPPPTAMASCHGGLQRKVQLGPAEGHRYRGPRHQRKSQLPGPVNHLPGLIPVVGELLVVEHRHGPARMAEDPYDLLQVAVARVELLVPDVGGVVAMLGNEQDAVHRQSVSAQGERLPDGRVAGHPPAPRPGGR